MVLLMCAASARAAPVPIYGGQLTVAADSGLQSLDPASARTETDALAIRLIYCRLFETGPDGAVIPSVAAEARGDAQNWRVRLREDVRFTNEEPLTAFHVKAAWEKTLMRMESLDGPLSLILGADQAWKQKSGGVTGLRAAGRHLLEIRLTKRTPDFPARLAQASASIYLPASGGEGVERFSYCGAFSPGSPAIRAEMLFVANRGHFAGRPYVDSLLLRHGLRETAARSELRRNRAALYVGGLIAFAAPFQMELPGRRFSARLSSRLRGDDAMVLARLLDTAVDRESIARVILRRRGEPPEGRPAYDPKGALEWLRRAAPRMLDREFIILTPSGIFGPNKENQLTRIAERIQVNLVDVGVKTRLQTASGPAWLKAMASGGYDIAITVGAGEIRNAMDPFGAVDIHSPGGTVEIPLCTLRRVLLAGDSVRGIETRHPAIENIWLMASEP
ncbi:MAG: hypothetical protein GMKNLPBB_00315 [Myxococcota bacterium]|nr:hypothetical protein [Myxococcota bacterium]